MKWLLPPILWLVCLLGITLTGIIFPSMIDSPYNYLGLVPAILGVALLLKAERMFKSINTNIKTFDNPDTLVTEGVFAWTRNPMYLGFLINLIGVSIIVCVPHSIAFVIIFFLAANYWYIPFEEKMALNKFGKDYEEYTKRAPRWLLK